MIVYNETLSYGLTKSSTAWKNQATTEIMCKYTTINVTRIQMTRMKCCPLSYYKLYIQMQAEKIQHYWFIQGSRVECFSGLLSVTGGACKSINKACNMSTCVLMSLTLVGLCMEDEPALQEAQHKTQAEKFSLILSTSHQKNTLTYPLVLRSPYWPLHLFLHTEKEVINTFYNIIMNHTQL